MLKYARIPSKKTPDKRIAGKIKGTFTAYIMARFF
jgi:hypothetical protein